MNTQGVCVHLGHFYLAFVHVPDKVWVEHSHAIVVFFRVFTE